MRDVEYFDDRLFVFSNAKLLEELKQYCKDNNSTMYLEVDKALREHMNKNLNIVFKERPKLVKLV